MGKMAEILFDNWPSLPCLNLKHSYNIRQPPGKVKHKNNLFLFFFSIDNGEALTHNRLYQQTERFKKMNNNFDTSSTGVNVEARLAYDEALAHMEFQDNFDRIQNSEYHFVYTSYGELSGEIYVTVKGLKSDLYDYYREHIYCYAEPMREFTKQELLDAVQDKLQEEFNFSLRHWDESRYNWKDGAEALQVELSHTYVQVQGYCQGDSAKVWYDMEGLKKLWGRTPTEEELKTDFEHMFYDQPISGSVYINDEEFYIDEYIKDRYTLEAEERKTILEKIVQEYTRKHGGDYDTILQEVVATVPQEPKYS